MKPLFFAVGSLGVAVGATLLVVAFIANVFLERSLSQTEIAFAFVGSLIVGFLWWIAMLRKVRQRNAGE